MIRRAVLMTGSVMAFVALLVSPPIASAQHEHHLHPPDEGWGWVFESSAFLTGNFQDREFRDFHQVESQNWFMGIASRRLGAGSISLHGMLTPHVTEPGDVTRVTASLEHEGDVGSRALALTVAWGQNREAFAVENGWLTEATLQILNRGTGYVREEIVDKHILGASGAHPPGQQHPHIISRVGALTVGYQYQLWRDATNAIAVGADVTGYHVPRELDDAYGRPLSAHAYVRWQVAVR